MEVFFITYIFYCQIFAIYNLLKWFKSTLLRNTYLAKSEENLLQFFTSSNCVIFPICRTNFCGYINLLKKDYSIMKPFKKLGYLIIYLCTQVSKYLLHYSPKLTNRIRLESDLVVKNNKKKYTTSYFLLAIKLIK